MSNVIKPYKIFILLIAFATLATAASAQTRKKKTAPKPKQEDPAITAANELYENMLGSTAQVMFIDSIVTSKNNLINAIKTSQEAGNINSYNKFWNVNDQPSAYTYINQLKNKVLFSKKDNDGHTSLYIADRINGQWAAPNKINDFGSEFEDINCPFLMPDGITLYFAAKGKNSVGGYDIFVTMYDADSARFYKPENIGLPFNSKANDYYYIIDEYNSIGWLVTDRNQPADSVCIYNFDVPQTRNTYNIDEIDDKKLRSLASIQQIKDTWTNKNTLHDALQRLKSSKQQNNQSNKQNINFYINDECVYTSLNDFKINTNRQKYTELTSKLKGTDQVQNSLEKLYYQYSNSTTNERTKLKSQIVRKEQQLRQLEQYTHSIEKEIRNSENKAFKR